MVYDLIVLGSPEPTVLGEIRAEIAEILKNFGLELGRDVGWYVWPDHYDPVETSCAAGLFFGGADPPLGNLRDLLVNKVPIIPLASTLKNVSTEIPEELSHFNALPLHAAGAARTVAVALLGCAGLMPRQRRVFLSYRRDDATPAAMRLFADLSAKGFEVFLDTHRIGAADDFQGTLWHRLCESDVLVMLDTEKYFESRWTNAEFGRALAKGMSILRVAWPRSTHDDRARSTTLLQLDVRDISAAGDDLTPTIVEEIAAQVEQVRGYSLAVRNLNLISNITNAIGKLGGTVRGLGRNRAIYLTLADGTELTAYPSVSVPTSQTMHDVAPLEGDPDVAIVYDHVGVLETWVKHLDWLGGHVDGVHWIKASNAAWDFAGWGT